MKIVRTLVVGAVSLGLGACCGGGPKTTRVEAATSSKAKLADPARIKAVKKVAIVSVISECDIRNEIKDESVFGKMSAVSAMKNQDALRTPAMLDLAAPVFAEEISKSSGWTVMPFQEMNANPAYAEKTFPADLREQVKAARKALGCSGAGYRVITQDYSDRAGALATALGVDAVVIGYFQTSLKYETVGVNATGTIWVNGAVSVIGQDGLLLLRDQVTTKSDDATPVIPKIDWAKVPALGVAAMRNAGRTFSADVRKATGAQPLPVASPAATPAPTP